VGQLLEVEEVATFLVADLVADQPVLPSEGRGNAWIGCVGLLMTAVFVSGIVLRPHRRHLGLGLDYWVAPLIYASRCGAAGRLGLSEVGR
jgi:cation:H+ antiporter